MRRSILITGASGFLGSRLLVHVLANAGRVVCMGRRSPSVNKGDVEFVAGDLLDPTACRRALQGCDTVLHLAAATGKHPPAEYFRVNRDGTAMLLQQSQDSGVERFLYVSTIAAKFENRLHYHYAQSKQQAEGLVEGSKLNWTIIRPTMIFGPGSPVQDGLRRLASLPVLPVFGNGQAPVQPISVEDAAKVIAEVFETNASGGRTIEIGGPEVLPIEDLLLRMRREAGVRNNRVIHLPVNPIAAILAGMEPVFRPWLPITAGQLASFVNPGDAAPDPCVAHWRPSMCPIDEMLRQR